ncbi:MAG: putative 7-carboxy-7-deazaguanine synthase QueE [Firmicutes bacterium HGW-Firmicutes-1]|jgi:7-carboxy-7-deazaguanine synthase|nr:MAG: putative 7-carboxy-7-deazaguanine synthase QueE [Firmicutes bacterium HGW-Firmicutes-1]
MTYKVVEKFISVNGEGRLSGQLALFIRFQGCNLSCSYCDTSWANDDNCLFTIMTKEELDQYIEASGIINITLTGGEPLIQEHFIELVEYLSRIQDRRIEIETNGSAPILPLKEIKNKNVFITMDYKLPSSGMEEHMMLTNLSKLTKDDTIKFVVGSESDLSKAKQLMNQFKLVQNTNVYISPVFGQITPEEIVEWLKDNLLNHVTLQLQLHKIIWGNDVKGV